MGNILIELVDINLVKHIEGFSTKRVNWLINKIRSEGVWNKPVALDSEFHLVLDGQHRMEAAKAMGLRVIPAVKFNYEDVELWSLRSKYKFDWRIVTDQALKGNIYPYKTVKHRFPVSLPECNYNLHDLMI